MKTNVLILYLLSHFSLSFAQEGSYYDYVELGPYSVGYSDTVIFDDSLQYKFGDYEGSAPIFAQLWFPFKGKSQGEKMTFRDFRSMEVPANVKHVYKDLELRKDSASIWYHIEQDFVKYKPIKYKISHKEVLEIMKGMLTKTERHNSLSKSRLAVIVYHHGAQGHSDENYVMAEYFASHGYIFISANYHLPVEGKYYGARVYKNGYNSTTPKRVIEFARNLTDSDKLFFIGHSMGGQTGYSFLRTKEDVSAFVCMETTAEGRSIAAQEKYWKEMYTILNKDSMEYKLPILHLASLGRTKPFVFWPFTKLHNADIHFVQPKIDFGHESYTASYIMRMFYKSDFKVPDYKALKKQMEWYVYHLKLIHDYLESHVKDTEFKYEEENPHFYFSRNK